MFLNYDFTFLVMLLLGNGQPWETEYHRCPANPLRHQCMLLSHRGMDTAADETVILTYWKLMDDVADHTFWKGLPYRFCALILRRHYRKARQFQPAFDAVVQSALQELGALEKAKSNSLDRTADTFARILQAAAQSGEDENQNRAMEQVLYHVGRWIYLIDAQNDLEEDRASGSYNPLLYRFSEGEDYRAYLKTNLDHSLNIAISAFGLLNESPFTPIIGNILYYGLPKVEEAVFCGRWKSLQKEMSRRKQL